MKSLQKNQGRTDQMLGAMADVLTSVALPNQQWLSEGGEADLPSSEEEKGPVQGQWDQDGPGWERQAVAAQNPNGSERTDSYSAAGSEGSISTSVASLPPQPSGSSAPSSPSSRRSVSALTKWLTNPVRKLSAGSTVKGDRQVRKLEGKTPPLSSQSQNQSQDLFSPEWKDGLDSPEDLSPESLQPSGFMTALPVDFTALPNTQDTQSAGLPPEDSESVLMDDTSSQWPAVADTEEERRSAFEKSMYVFYQDGCPHIMHGTAVVVGILQSYIKRGPAQTATMCERSCRNVT
ncbi:PREDICTED: rho guanine nucleotide exchange factor 25-like isoform X2 [Poecilia mexicana]|uniref:rho guanine nucleotide exchange factor 25-like isoform X2 n=1 Tax=Poecilia mexicana TaxID=48701 RepID=UPI00072E2E3C|nr:PREDICTED: rho guanine nucleotide exchange factor 25-like isoform X2 [Poecilia mexicana]